MSDDASERGARTGSPFVIRLARALWRASKLLFVEVVGPFLWRAALWTALAFAFYRMMDVIEDSFPRPATDIGEVLERKLCAAVLVGGAMVIAEAVTSSTPFTRQKLARRWVWSTAFVFWMVGHRAMEQLGIHWFDYSVAAALIAVAYYLRRREDSRAPSNLPGTRSVA